MRVVWEVAGKSRGRSEEFAANAQEKEEGGAQVIRRKEIRKRKENKEEKKRKEKISTSAPIPVPRQTKSP